MFEGWSMVDTVTHVQVVQIYTLQMWCDPIVYSDTLYAASRTSDHPRIEWRIYFAFLQFADCIWRYMDACKISKNKHSHTSSWHRKLHHLLIHFESHWQHYITCKYTLIMLNLTMQVVAPIDLPVRTYSVPTDQAVNLNRTFCWRFQWRHWRRLHHAERLQRGRRTEQHRHPLPTSHPQLNHPLQSQRLLRLVGLQRPGTGSDLS